MVFVSGQVFVGTGGDLQGLEASLMHHALKLLLGHLSWSLEPGKMFEKVYESQSERSVDQISKAQLQMEVWLVVLLQPPWVIVVHLALPTKLMSLRVPPSDAGSYYLPCNLPRPSFCKRQPYRHCLVPAEEAVTY